MTRHANTGAEATPVIHGEQARQAETTTGSPLVLGGGIGFAAILFTLIHALYLLKKNGATSAIAPLLNGMRGVLCARWSLLQIPQFRRDPAIAVPEPDSNLWRGSKGSLRRQRCSSTG